MKKTDSDDGVSFLIVKDFFSLLLGTSVYNGYFKF